MARGHGPDVKDISIGMQKRLIDSTAKHAPLVPLVGDGRLLIFGAIDG